MKEKVLHSYSDKDISVIHNQEELNILEEEIRNYLSDLSSNNAPAFEFALEGDIIKDDVWNVFFKTANFIENSGSNVEKVGAYIDKCDLAVQDRIFLRALLIFWSFFDKTLPDPHHLFRYHTLFELFSEDNIMKYDAWPTTAGTMKHLLIDEFQDISPEIVKWIRGVLKYLNHIGVETSLMCIGDDWQSIYGWRGSSPYYIIKYQDEFRSEPPARTMKLIENWRSYQDLLNDAESVLKKIDKNRRTDKKVECKKGKNPIEESTLDLIRGEDNDEICSTVKEVIQKATLGEKIYVLCRTKDKRNQLARSLKGLPVKVMTYHGCKGLEAHSCILVGDCAYNTSSPFKNMVYKVNGNTDRYQLTYDAAQRDEARRLAYVALTRAEKKCYWFADSRNNGCFLDLIIEKRQDEDLEPF